MARRNFCGAATRHPPGPTGPSLVATMAAGLPKTNILEMLRPFRVTSEAGAASGDSHYQEYRLDDAWLLRCALSHGNQGPRDGTLISAELLDQCVMSGWHRPRILLAFGLPIS